MHIGFITPEYPHPDLGRSGGLGTSIKNLAVELVKNSIEVTIFVGGQKEASVFKDENIRIITIAKKNYTFGGWYLWRRHFEKVVREAISKYKIDLLEAPDWTGITAFMKFSVPLIIRLNGSDGYFCHLDRRKQHWKNRFLEKKALKNADQIVSVSSFTALKTNEVFNLNKTISVIHNSIDVTKFTPENNVAIEPNQILYFGTVIRKKGVLDLAQAFNLIVKENKDSKLVLLGKDTNDVFEKTSTIKLFYDLLSENAKQRVTHLPEIPYNMVKEYIAKANVIVLPSFAEAFPMTWLETLAMEKPLVSSNIGWANELMVDEETGFTVNPKDHKEFSNKVLKLLSDNDLAVKFGENGRQHVINNFSTEIITEKNIKFYKSLIYV